MDVLRDKEVELMESKFTFRISLLYISYISDFKQNQLNINTSKYSHIAS